MLWKREVLPLGMQQKIRKEFRPGAFVGYAFGLQLVPYVLVESRPSEPRLAVMPDEKDWRVRALIRGFDPYGLEGTFVNGSRLEPFPLELIETAEKEAHRVLAEARQKAQRPLVPKPVAPEMPATVLEEAKT